VRQEVEELPPATPTISTITPRLDHGPERWSLADDGSLQGLTIGTATLGDGAEAVVEYILHEAAHVLAWQRGVKDTTMRGAYHNGSYLAVAEEVGLRWSEDQERSAHRGFYHPAMTAETAQRHAPDVAALATAIPATLPHLTLPAASKSTRPARILLECGCDEPRTFRIGRTVAAKGPIICGVCKEVFTERK
jgi:predicted SprT family Zn-dependent metalloprotease